jgi:hypothetical protein
MTLLGAWRARGERRPSAGQTLVFFAVALPAMMALMALGIDGANVYLQHRVMQSAADLAALGGANVLPHNPNAAQYAAARDRARLVASENGYPSGVEAVAPYVDEGGTTHPYQVEVTINSSVSTFFLPVLGVNTVDVAARAVAGSEWTATGGSFPAVFAACTTTSAGCPDKAKAIDWSGSDGQVMGGIHSNCGVHAGGQNNSVEGDTTYSAASGCGFSGGGNTYDPAQTPSDPQPWPVDYTAASFTCDPDKIVNGKLELKNYYQSPASAKVLKPGVYCARGSSAEIVLDEGGVTGNVTLVVDRGTEDCSVSSPEGKEITISGSNFNLTAFHSSKVLMYTNVRKPPTIKISGSDGTWNGLIIAPCGQVEISGQSVGTSGGGSILASSVKIAGSDVKIDSAGLDDLGPAERERLRLLE